MQAVTERKKLETEKGQLAAQLITSKQLLESAKKDLFTA